MFCDWCEAEFDTAIELGRHIARERHLGNGHEADSEAHLAKKEERERKAGRGHGGDASAKTVNTHCPNCNFEIPYTTAWGYGEATVCPKCLCTFSTRETDATTGAYFVIKKPSPITWATTYALSREYFTWQRENWPALRGMKAAERDRLYRLPEKERAEALSAKVSQVRL